MRFERVARMIEEINKGRYPNVEHFCREFEIAPRTALGDIRYLKENMQQEILYDKYRGGYYNKNPKKELPQFNLTHGEVFALTLGKEMLSQYTGTSFEPLLRSAIEKICERLPQNVNVNIDDIKCMVKFHSNSVIPISKKLFLDINRACEKSLPVSIVYFGAKRGDTTERTIHPYRIIENRSTWYVVGHCRLRNDLRMFALHRIKSYKLIDERFRMPETLDIDKWLESAFQLEHGDPEQTVKVRFQPLSARYIRERSWHPSQQLEEHPDGACTLEFKSQNIEEAKRWVLTYGADAEVLEPIELRKLVADELHRAASQYNNQTND